MDIEAYKQIIKNKMSERRYHHSLMVANEAVRLAEIYGGNVLSAQIAGILHDITKEITVNEHLQIFKNHDIMPVETAKLPRQLWHSLTGSYYIADELYITDSDIINAVRYHTTGRAGMCLLEKIIFVADFTSAERAYDGVDIMRELCNKSLEDAMLFGVSFSITDLTQRRLPIHNNTVELYNELVMK